MGAPCLAGCANTQVPVFRPCLAQVLAFPVVMLIRFWVNHHLLDIFQRPLWRVVRGRSKVYVDRVCSGGGS